MSWSHCDSGFLSDSTIAPFFLSRTLYTLTVTIVPLGVVSIDVTKCMLYGSSKPSGSTPSGMDTEDGRVFLNREIVAQTADMALIYLYRGEQIVREWDFYVGEEALPGSYSLTLTFRGEEVVIPDFITVL